MTRTTNVRIAGVTFLAYIAAGITHIVLFRWLSMLAFEVPLGLWLLTRGVVPARARG